jgi:Flp pilus assembly protein TadD
VVRAANSPRTPDWRLTSAEGAIQDQLGNSAEARRLYQEALKLAPDEPTVLNNLGLSYVFTNELAKAETTLRRAVASPRADSRVRQNLALVVGLQGRFDEADRLAAAELPPEEAKANVAYLRGLLSQPDTWKQLKQADKKSSAG